MITAKDFKEKLDLLKNEKNEILDKWLEDEVLPKFTRNRQGFKIPEKLSLNEVESLLNTRGFHVTAYSDHQEPFVYISLPPQSE